MLTISSAVSQCADASSDADRIEFFEKRIRPVLVEHCYECHSNDADSPMGGLLLDSRDSMRKGGDSGEAIVPGDLDASLLIAALKYESFEMPPDGKLSDEVITDFIRWVEMGAPDPREDQAIRIADMPRTEIDWETARRFWAFQSPHPQEKPGVVRADWPQSPIDAFILARLEQEGLTPNEPADPQSLLRRLSFDLTGLPPTADRTDVFVSDYARHPDHAVENAVTELIDSPHFGERWAALWLDVMRYAEDQAHIVGNNKSLFFPNAYLYRDWVINAFNNDLPYDEFLRRQLAADLLYPDDSDSHVALGFIGLGPKYYRRNSPEVMAEEWENQVDTLARGLLGLTVACARCHNHKYDPVTTEDYYALAGVFAGTEMFNQPLEAEAERSKDGQAKQPDEARHVVRDKQPVDLNVMIRGDVKNKGPVVPRGFLQVLCQEERECFTEGSGRRELAEAIASPGNPLTARVIVNRVWGEMFGRPLVGTPSNFGVLGERPSHPKLLDDLAFRFMQHGWSLKWLIREIALSATYQQSSRIDTEHVALDPANILLGRMPRRRLSIEQWRDTLLTAAGKLDPQVGGPSFDPTDLQATRRTVYAARSRLQVAPLLKTFDFPDPNAHAARRVETTTPLQKLFALNSPMMVSLAESIVKQHPSANADPAKPIRQVYRQILGHDPTDEEFRLAVTYLDQGDEARWVEYVQVLLASNELLYVD